MNSPFLPVITATLSLPFLLLSNSSNLTDSGYTRNDKLPKNRASQESIYMVPSTGSIDFDYFEDFYSFSKSDDLLHIDDISSVFDLVQQLSVQQNEIDPIILAAMDKFDSINRKTNSTRRR